MSRYVGKNNVAGPILKAAEHWKQTSLLSDKGIFEGKEIWKGDYFEELHQYLIKRLDKNKDVFIEKLENLLESRPLEVNQLAAEIWWLMFLCHDKYKIQRKRENIKTIWERSGEPFPKNSEWLADEVLAGIANVGAGIFSRLAWEWEFFILLMIELKKLPVTQRKELLSDGWKFAEWVERIPECATRQSRHMILFLLFPDNFERIFSADHRKKIVSKFTGKAAQKLSAVEIDHHLLNIRRKKEKEHGTEELDFFNPPLNEWENENSQNTEKAKATAEKADGKIGGDPSTERATGKATNLILYGPPGTGKTWELNRLTEKYSSREQAPNRKAWLIQELSEARWVDVIFGALYDLGRKAKVGAILKHEYVQIKADIASGKHIRTIISIELGEHARKSEHVHVQDQYRRPPFIFDKNQDGIWSLVNDWEEECQEQVELAKNWKRGSNQESSTNQRFERFEFVTFHPAYGYEDFVEGIRPILDEKTESVTYEVVPGVFKRICQKAKADTGQRYAIFIDEINRGNIASIFGELITLLETDKRVVYQEDGSPESGMTLTLPYSGERFGVPANLDVYGTMNTADRSIALLDTALRRRFQFEELMPDASVIKGSLDDGHIEDGEGGTIDLRALLEAINSRISFLLSRDMTIGHAYFINVRNFSELKNVLLSRIIPLLQEYFYEDWHRIQLVFRDVGPSREKLEPQIIRHKPFKEVEVLGFDHDDFEDSTEYRVANETEIIPAAIRKVYEESD